MAPVAGRENLRKSFEPDALTPHAVKACCNITIITPLACHFERSEKSATREKGKRQNQKVGGCVRWRGFDQLSPDSGWRRRLGWLCNAGDCFALVPRACNDGARGETLRRRVFCSECFHLQIRTLAQLHIFRSAHPSVLHPVLRGSKK